MAGRTIKHQQDGGKTGPTDYKITALIWFKAQMDTKLQAKVQFTHAAQSFNTVQYKVELFTQNTEFSWSDTIRKNPHLFTTSLLFLYFCCSSVSLLRHKFAAVHIKN